MGWKNVKDHYRIGHIVHVKDHGICIGSPYISDIIVIDPSGKIIKRLERAHGDLGRYQSEMDADREKLRRLIEAPDEFARSIPVYTYQDDRIIEKRCEEPGWPNVTHDGELMYENTHSTDKQEVIAWAKRNAQHGVSMFRADIRDAEQKLQELRAQLAEEERIVASLAALYPAEESAGQQNETRVEGSRRPC